MSTLWGKYRNRNKGKMRIRVKKVAAEKGITQKELAMRLGVSIYTVQYYYKSEILSMETIVKIADALDCPLWKLFADEKEVLKEGEGTVLTPKGERVPLNALVLL